MPKWIETEQFMLSYDMEEISEETKKGSLTRYHTSYKNLDDKLKSLTAHLNKMQYKILSVTPLTTALTAHELDYSRTREVAYGWGYGYGMTMNTGILVFAQREIEISEHEYQERMARINKESALRSLIQKQNDEQSVLESLRSNKQENLKSIDYLNSLQIKEEKKLFGGCNYCIDGKTFKSRDEAEQYKQKCQDYARSLQMGMDEVINKIENVQVKITNLDHDIAQANAIFKQS